MNRPTHRPFGRLLGVICTGFLVLAACSSTQAYSDKAWRTPAFTEDQIAADTQSSVTVRG